MIAGMTDCRKVRLVTPNYKSLVINVPHAIAAIALMKLTGDYSSRDIQLWKAEHMYDVGGTQGTAVHNRKTNQMFKFAARASIPQEDIWALGGLIPFVIELLETGGAVEDATLAGKEHLAKAGIIDGYKYGGPIPVGIEIYMNDKQEEIRGVQNMKAITPGRDNSPYPRQSTGNQAQRIQTARGKRGAKNLRQDRGRSLLRHQDHYPRTHEDHRGIKNLDENGRAHHQMAGNH